VGLFEQYRTERFAAQFVQRHQSVPDDRVVLVLECILDGRFVGDAVDAVECDDGFGTHPRVVVVERRDGGGAGAVAAEVPQRFDGELPDVHVVVLQSVREQGVDDALGTRLLAERESRPASVDCVAVDEVVDLLLDRIARHGCDVGRL